MRDREIIEQYIKSIKDELMMYNDSLSEKSLDYIKKLKKQYNCWEKDLDKLDGYNEPKIHTEEDNDTFMDENLNNMLDEYMAYLNYYDEYKETNSMEKLEMARTELGHFLTLLSDVFTEVSERCSEDIESRTLVKNAIKNIYTNFG